MEKYLTGVGMNHLVQWAVDYFGWKEADYVEMMKRLHPVGTYYWSSEPTSPAQLFGGTWQQVSGYYMYATTNTNTGGASSVTLTSSHMPSHTHNFSGTHTHTIASHTHNINGHSHTGSTSHTHDIHHTHNYGIEAPSKTVSVNYAPYWNVFCSRGSMTSVQGGWLTVSTTVNISASSGGNGNTTTTSVSGSLSSAGNGNSGSPSSTSVSYSGSNISIELNPPYINAYCWYRSA